MAPTSKSATCRTRFDPKSAFQKTTVKERLNLPEPPPPPLFGEVMPRFVRKQPLSHKIAAVKSSGYGASGITRQTSAARCPPAGKTQSRIPMVPGRTSTRACSVKSVAKTPCPPEKIKTPSPVKPPETPPKTPPEILEVFVTAKDFLNVTASPEIEIVLDPGQEGKFAELQKSLNEPNLNLVDLNEMNEDYPGNLSLGEFGGKINLNASYDMIEGVSPPRIPPYYMAGRIDADDACMEQDGAPVLVPRQATPIPPRPPPMPLTPPVRSPVHMAPRRRPVPYEHDVYDSIPEEVQCGLKRPMGETPEKTLSPEKPLSPLARCPFSPSPPTPKTLTELMDFSGSNLEAPLQPVQKHLPICTDFIPEHSPITIALSESEIERERRRQCINDPLFNVMDEETQQHMQRLAPMNVIQPRRTFVPKSPESPMRFPAPKYNLDPTPSPPKLKTPTPSPRGMPGEDCGTTLSQLFRTPPVNRRLNFDDVVELQDAEDQDEDEEADEQANEEADEEADEEAGEDADEDADEEADENRSPEKHPRSDEIKLLTDLGLNMDMPLWQISYRLLHMKKDRLDGKGLTNNKADIEIRYADRLLSQARITADQHRKMIQKIYATTGGDASCAVGAKGAGAAGGAKGAGAAGGARGAGAAGGARSAGTTGGARGAGTTGGAGGAKNAKDVKCVEVAKPKCPPKPPPKPRPLTEKQKQEKFERLGTTKEEFLSKADKKFLIERHVEIAKKNEIERAAKKAKVLETRRRALGVAEAQIGQEGGQQQKEGESQLQ